LATLAQIYKENDLEVQVLLGGAGLNIKWFATAFAIVAAVIAMGVLLQEYKQIQWPRDR
jgi:Na+/alanine symporter